MSDINESKRRLREHYKAVRASGSGEDRRQADRRITAYLTERPEYKKARLVLTYVSAGQEPDTLELIAMALAQGKEVACPLCHKPTHTMTFHKISSLGQLTPGAYGICEPPADAPSAQPEEMQHSVCIVPGLAFDSCGGRLGYGGGYYDRFLAGYSGVSIGLCREETCSAQPLPRDEYDIPVDIVVTDRGLSAVAGAAQSDDDEDKDPHEALVILEQIADTH